MRYSFPQALSVFPAFYVMMAAPAAAGPLQIDVRGVDGRPLAGAVVLVDTPRKPAGPIRFPWGTEMAQRNIAFDPHVLIVPVGATVTFPNKDKVRHHVYSFSRTKAFNLKLYGPGVTPSITFDRPGLVSLGCNIHDAMSGFVMVVDTPYAVTTDANGRASFANIPAGGATLRIWHPGVRTPDNFTGQSIAVPAGAYSMTYTVRGR